MLSSKAILATALAAAVVAGTGATARAESPAGCYAVAADVLTAPAGADLTLRVTSAEGCAAPTALKKVQIKKYDADGKLADVSNVADVAVAEGTARLQIGEAARGTRVEADVLVDGGRTSVVRSEATALLRPDLTVAAVQAPPQTLTVRPIDVTAQIASDGDVQATATATLSWGPSVLATTQVTIPAGGTSVATFGGIALTTAAATELTVTVTDAAPAERDATNNARSTTVDVTEFELARSRLVLDSLGGYGAQFNQHVYAPITTPDPSILAPLEEKAKALEPQLVRIFFHEIDERDPTKMASFIEAVELAHQSGATINITYATTANARLRPDPFMSTFADLLKNLVVDRKFANVRWVTIQNEPNGPNLITLPQYEALHRSIHAHLIRVGLRQQIGIMAGDLIEGAPARDHEIWFKYITANFAEIVDAYSEHIYWNYFDIPRMEFRLRDVRKLMIEDVAPEDRRPVYIMEFGVRGVQQCGGKPVIDPHYWQPDCTPMNRTNISAFQHLFFNITAAQMGFSGTSKWDAFWGKYNAGTQAHWLIGPPEEGFPLFPGYHALRLMLQTTERGWSVVGVDPWADDDWKLNAEGRPFDQAEKELAAYEGPDSALTILGLDSRGRDLNAASTEQVAYSVGGVTPGLELRLKVWNATGNGETASAVGVRANAAGVVRFEVPVHAAFALTTVAVS